MVLKDPWLTPTFYDANLLPLHTPDLFLCIRGTI